LAVDAEDTLDVHPTFDACFDRTKLYSAMLGDGGNAGCETAGKPDQHEFNRRCAIVLTGKDRRVIGIEFEFRLMGLFFAEPEKFLHGGMAVRAVDPFTGCTPFELGGLRRGRQRLPGAEQCFYIDTVVDFGALRSHSPSSFGARSRHLLPRLRSPSRR